MARCLILARVKHAELLKIAAIVILIHYYYYSSLSLQDESIIKWCCNIKNKSTVMPKT